MIGAWPIWLQRVGCCGLPDITPPVLLLAGALSGCWTDRQEPFPETHASLPRNRVPSQARAAEVAEVLQPSGSSPDASPPIDSLDSEQSSEPSDSTPGPVAHVVVISVDGLGARYLDPMVPDGQLPAFAHLQQVGAWTHNARSDYSETHTLPNHTSMLTGPP